MKEQPGIQPEKMSRIESALHDDAIMKARSFTKIFKVDQKLGFAAPQTEIFNLYFAHYFLRKKGAGTESLLKEPESEIMMKIPVIKYLGVYLNYVLRTEDKVASVILNEAEEKSEHYIEIVKQTVNELLEENTDTSDATLFYQTKFGPELTDEALRTIGSPNAIKRAANLLSSECILNKDKPELLNTKIPAILDGIKKRDFPRNV